MKPPAGVCIAASHGARKFESGPQLSKTFKKVKACNCFEAIQDRARLYLIITHAATYTGHKTLTESAHLPSSMYYMIAYLRTSVQRERLQIVITFICLHNFLAIEVSHAFFQDLSKLCRSAT
jgi:hypothetical protein